MSFEFREAAEEKKASKNHETPREQQIENVRAWKPITVCVMPSPKSLLCIFNSPPVYLAASIWGADEGREEKSCGEKRKMNRQKRKQKRGGFNLGRKVDEFIVIHTDRSDDKVIRSERGSKKSLHEVGSELSEERRKIKRRVEREEAQKKLTLCKDWRGAKRPLPKVRAP
jgi:hypothetical protein